MPLRDLTSNVKPVMLIGPVSADSTQTPSEGVDLQGASMSDVHAMVGAGGITFDGDNRIDFVLEHSDSKDSGFEPVVSWRDINVGEVDDNGVFQSINEAHESPAVYQIGYVGDKRYLRVVATFEGTHGAETPIAAMVLLGGLHMRPDDLDD